MNRNLYRLVQNILGQWVAVPEITRGKRKGGGAARKAISAFTIVGFATCAGFSGVAVAAGSLPTAFDSLSFASKGSADYSAVGNVGTISQVGTSAVVNFKDFNVGVGNKIIYQQVKDLQGHELVGGATFNNLTRIWDSNPSIIAGAIQAAAGQHVNLMMINQNGILFTPTAQVDVNSLTVSSLNLTDKALNDYLKGNIAPADNIVDVLDSSGNKIGKTALPQFVGDTGFVKVMEGARITAGSGGSVILIAPTVTNRGSINTKDSGQSILAAGNRVYLMANQDNDGNPIDGSLKGFLVEVDNTNLGKSDYNSQNSFVPKSVTLDGNQIDVADNYDRLGNATNLGSITSARGNITMVGLAVNQMNRATATTTVNVNGSIYLYAKDSVIATNEGKSTGDVVTSTRGGKLTLGTGSVTEVLPEVADKSTTLQSEVTKLQDKINANTIDQTLNGSIVRMVGKDVAIESSALVDVPAGKVDVYALENPSLLPIFNNTLTTNPFVDVNNIKDDSHIYMASDALIDVSGVSVEKSVADNYVKLTLRGDQLADSPVNRNDFLRGKSVWVDLIAGSPLISDIAAQRDNMALSVADISTKAGTVNLKSTGQVVVDNGAKFNLSGGKTVYNSALQYTSQLVGADGRIYNVDNAPADIKYTGIVGYVYKDHGRWGVTEAFGSDQKTFVTGYVMGADAGNLNLSAPQLYFAGSADGSKTIGAKQAAAGTPPTGAKLTIDNKVIDVLLTNLTGINQSVEIGNAPVALYTEKEIPTNSNNFVDVPFVEGTNLPVGKSHINENDSGAYNLANTLNLDAGLFGANGFSSVSINSTKDINVNSAVILAPKGSISLTGHNVNVNANIKAEAGAIKLTANPDSVLDVKENNVVIAADQPKLTVAEGVTLSAAGGWYNDLLTGNTGSNTKTINAGTVSLTANSGEIDLKDGSILDVRSGGYITPSNSLKAGSGGNVSLGAWKVASDTSLQSHFKGEALGAGGTLSVNAANVIITNQPASNSVQAGDWAMSTLWITPEFFQQGFANYNVTGLAGLQLTSGTHLAVQNHNLQLLPSANLALTGSDIESLTTKLVLPDQQRSAANISLSSTSLQSLAGSKDLLFGQTNLAKDTSVNVDPGGVISIASAKNVELDGTLIAKAGTINASLSIDKSLINDTVDSPARLHLGSQAILDVSGVAKVYPNAGLNLGNVLSGGTVNLTSNTYVTAEQGANIDVHGAKPVTVDITNTSGTLGQSVASDAGKVNVTADSGIYLDNTFNAEAGSISNKGGTFSLKAGDSNAVIHVGQFGSLAPVGTPLESQRDQFYADLPKFVNAGFDNINLTSDNQIKFEGDFSAGLNRVLPIQSLVFNAPNVVSSGGNTLLQANIVEFSHGISATATSTLPDLGAGHLSVKANLIELTGQVNFSGLVKSDSNGAGLSFDSAGEFRLTGAADNTNLLQAGGLSTLADINIKARVVSPSTLANFVINTTGDVNFLANGVATQPMSALGNLTVNANNINQSGNIIVPFGNVSLIATNSLTLGEGSVTSVAGNNDVTIPFGKTSNGINYYVDLNNDGKLISTTSAENIKTLPTKSLLLNGKSVDVKSTAQVSVAGGGHLQAWEFAAGPGGSADILADKVVNGVTVPSGYYAIVPGYQGIASPSSPEKDGSSALGQSIYLSGGNGLSAGFYTLMPAHYALLPGAYAVKVTGAVQDLLPTNNSVKQDGTIVVSGFLTDSRQTQTNPGNARWMGFELLSRYQVEQRSGYTLAQASNFFANNPNSSLPSDAGLLQFQTKTAFNLAGLVNTTAAAGGKGAAVDISADNIALVDNTASSPDEVTLDISALNKLKADSLLIGGLRSKIITDNVDGSTTVSNNINVTATNVRMDGKANSPLTARELMLAAKDTVAIQNNSKIVASGATTTDTAFQLNGSGAFVRAATNDASITRNKDAGQTSIDHSIGSILAGVNTQITSANSITLDATKDNAYQGGLGFVKDGKLVAGNLTIGASKINLTGLASDVPSGVEGLVFDQHAIDGFSTLNSLHLRTYSTFDFYGNSTLGTVDNTGKYSLTNLSLEGGGLNGYGTSNNEVNINAKTLIIANPDGVSALAANGQGKLNLNSNQLILGAGDKQISGFAQTNIQSSVVIGQDKGVLAVVDGDVNINTTHMIGEVGADQSINAIGDLNVARLDGAFTIAPATTLGANWTLVGANTYLDTSIENHGGDINLIATTGNVTLGEHANIDVTGKLVTFFDKTIYAQAGNVNLKAASGDVVANAGSIVNVSAVAGGDAGSLKVSATNGNVDIASANLLGKNEMDASGNKGVGALFGLDAKTVTSFDTLNHTLNDGGFNETRNVRLRTGDLNLTQAETGTIKAHNVTLAVDAGTLNLNTTIDASGSTGGDIGLYANGDVTLYDTANLVANSTKGGEKGGNVNIGSISGTITLQGGSISVANSSGQDSGNVLLRTSRTDNSVAVNGQINTKIQGAASVVLEGVKTYTKNQLGNEINTINAVGTGKNGADTGSSLSVTTMVNDIENFMGHKSSIVNSLGDMISGLGAKFHLRGGSEVDAVGDLTVAKDVNFYKQTRVGNEPGTLTLRAAVNLNVNGSISDGFSTKTPAKDSVSTLPSAATVLASNDSWSYRLVAGADTGAANPMTVNQNGTGDFALAAGKLIRTGTGDIQIASAGNFDLGKTTNGLPNSQTSVIYTAGKLTQTLDGFTPPKGSQFGTQGGNIDIDVKGNLNGAVSDQLYVNWLNRVGSVDTAGNFLSGQQTAWWVDYSKFNQGVATFGGGNVNISAGQTISDLNASTVTNGRMASSSPDASMLTVLGGGDMKISSDGDIKGGNYYVEQGKLTLQAQGSIGSGNQVAGSNFYSVIALGNASANISAKNDVNIQTVLNPFTLGLGALLSTSYFSTYGDQSAVNLMSLQGNVNFNNYILSGVSTTSGAALDITSLDGVYGLAAGKGDILSMPSTLKAISLQGDVNVNGDKTISLFPRSNGQLELLAENNVNINQQVLMSDQLINATATGAPSADGISLAVNISHADSMLVHADDLDPAKIYAVDGNINFLAAGGQVQVPKSLRMIAGQNVINPIINTQNLRSSDVTYIKAGQDIKYTPDVTGSTSGITVNGPGVVQLVAGRNVDLGTSAGIITNGNLINTALSGGGASVRVDTGLPNGVDYVGAIARLESALGLAVSSGQPVSDSTLWEVRWLVAKDDANYATLAGEKISDAKANPQALLRAVTKVANMTAAAQEDRVRNMFFQALRDTGRDHNNAQSPYFGQYTRGYDAISLLFPEKDTNQKTIDYSGTLSLFLSRIKTANGGDIEFMVPGGGLLGGLADVPADANIPNNLGATGLGIVAVGQGSVRGFTRDSMIVNQSRILTTGNAGDNSSIVLWSSLADIDAGKGKKTAVSIPPPIILVKNGVVTITPQPAATGSGIGALGDAASLGCTACAGSVDLIAPKGTVNAGDAGIRAGNINIAAQTVLGADNIVASGSTSGVPVSDAGALAGSLSGASGVGGDATKQVSDQIAQNTKQATENNFKKTPSPSFINVEVVSIGD